MKTPFYSPFLQKGEAYATLPSAEMTWILRKPLHSQKLQVIFAVPLTWN